jgi:Flp pilus assembly secretin CpaC
MGRFVLGGLFVAVALAGTASACVAQSPVRFYVALDKSKILELPEPVRKVSITTPAIADVTVLSPTSLLVNGKTVGVTSLIVFSKGRAARYYDLVVHPAPVVDASAPMPDAETHTVLVQRADKITNHLFVRDKDQMWLELGAVKPATEAVKK